MLTKTIDLGMVEIKILSFKSFMRLVPREFTHRDVVEYTRMESYRVLYGRPVLDDGSVPMEDSDNFLKTEQRILSDFNSYPFLVEFLKLHTIKKHSTAREIRQNFRNIFNESCSIGMMSPESTYLVRVGYRAWIVTNPAHYKVYIYHDQLAPTPPLAALGRINSIHSNIWLFEK